MIREDNITLQSLEEDLKRENITLKEYVTRSEHSDFFSTALNKQLLNTYKNYPVAYKKAFRVIQSDGKDIKFPNIFGIQPHYVPELSEIPFDQMDSTAVTLEPLKFGLRMGISQEMIDDNEVSLMSWTTDMMGQKVAMLYDQECFKMLDAYNQTGVSTICSGWSGGQIGCTTRGAYYSTGQFTHTMSASAANWEQLINTAVSQLQTQQISLGSRNYKYPVNADTIIAHSVRDMSLRKVLNSSVIIGATGIGDAGNADITQVAGKNVFNQMLNIVTTPYLQRGTGYITKANRGLVLVQRKSPSIEKQQNWAFDAQEAKVTMRFIPGIIDERSVFATLLGTA